MVSFRFLRGGDVVQQKKARGMPVDSVCLDWELIADFIFRASGRRYLGGFLFEPLHFAFAHPVTLGDEDIVYIGFCIIPALRGSAIDYK